MFKIYADHEDDIVLKLLGHNEPPVMGYRRTRLDERHSFRLFQYGIFDGRLFIGNRKSASQSTRASAAWCKSLSADPYCQDRVRITGIASIGLEGNELRVRDLSDGDLNPIGMLMRIVNRDCLRSRGSVSSGVGRLFFAGLCGWLVDAAPNDQEHSDEQR